MAVTTQKLYDNTLEALFKFTNVSDGSGETDAVKVDVSLLNDAVHKLTHGNSESGKAYVVGETVIQAVSGAQGKVVNVPDATHVWIALDRGFNIDFDTTNTITGQISTKVETPSVNDMTAPRVDLIEAQWYSDARVDMEWDDSSTDELIFALNGYGKMDMQKLSISNNASTPTGDIIFTQTFTVGQIYTVLLKVRKTEGFGINII